MSDAVEKTAPFFQRQGRFAWLETGRAARFLWGRGTQATQRNGRTEPLARITWRGPASESTQPWLGSASTRARTAPPRWSAAGTAPKASDPGILHCSPPALSPCKGSGLKVHWGQRQGTGCQSPADGPAACPHLMESETCGAMSTTSLLEVLCCFRDKPTLRLTGSDFPF